MAEIPEPEYSISTTPKELNTTASASANSPRNSGKAYFSCFIKFLPV